MNLRMATLKVILRLLKALNFRSISSTDVTIRPFIECDWGPFEHEVFGWINGNGIWQDAWKSILLSKMLRPEYGEIRSQPEGTPNAFACPEGRNFLLEQIKAGISPLAALKKAHAAAQEEYFKTELERLIGEIERK